MSTQRRTDRLMRALERCEHGSDRRRAVKTALFRLLYTPSDVQVPGTVTGRFVGTGLPPMQEGWEQPHIGWSR